MLLLQKPSVAFVVSGALLLMILCPISTIYSQESIPLEFRVWKLATGRTSDVKLAFIAREGSAVKLQREDNQKIIELSMAQLSAEDRTFVTQTVARLSREATKQAPLKAETADWPGWRGADRTGVSKESGLLAQWAPAGPKLDWQIDGIGQGYSTPTIADGKVFVLGTKGNQEILYALDEKNGREIWTCPMGTVAGGGGYPGPRSSATVDSGSLFAIGSDGTLIAANVANGKLLWKKNFRQDFGGQCGSWDYSESPLVDGDAVICTPGGTASAIVSLNRKNGEANWQASTSSLGDDYGRAAYSSPIVAEVEGVKQYIQFLNKGVAGFRASDGSLLWHYDPPANGTANCSTPICRDGYVFAASGYGTGGGLAKINRNGEQFEAVEQYFVKQMQNHHGGMVLVGDHLYGTNDGTLLCIQWDSGEIAWQERGVGKGAVTFADGHLYVRSENGPVALVEANPEEYREVGRFDQPNRSNKNAWAHPVVANGKLYLRDDDILLCYDVKK